MNIDAEALLTTGSIVVALVLFGFGYLERRSSDRRKRTLDFLLAMISEDGDLGKANLDFAVGVAEGRAYDDDGIAPSARKVVVKLLDYYDLIADTAVKGVVDKETIITHLGGRMRSTYFALEAYIASRRERLKRPGLYRSFERFVLEDIRERDV